MMWLIKTCKIEFSIKSPVFDQQTYPKSKTIIENSNFNVFDHPYALSFKTELQDYGKSSIKLTVQLLSLYIILYYDVYCITITTFQNNKLS